MAQGDVRVIDLRDCRAALATLLEEEGYNVSSGGDLVPEGAAIGGFVCNYHVSIGAPVITRVGLEVRLALSRADEASAMSAQDAAMTTVWAVLEGAAGPWHALIVQTSRPDVPLTVGDATYQTLALVLELHV